MDGYAVRAADLASLPARLALIGTAAAGHGYAGQVGAGEAVRIFTGAPVPAGADTIVIQENADPDVLHDLAAFMTRLISRDESLYRHTVEGTGRYAEPHSLDALHKPRWRSLSSIEHCCLARGRRFI